MYYKTYWMKAILATSVVFLSLLTLLLMVDMIVAVDASAKEEAIAARPSSAYTSSARPTPEDQNSAQESERHTASSPFSKKFERGGPLLAELSAVYMRSAVGRPWDSNANEDRMDDLFGKGKSQKLEYENVEPVTITRIFSSKTDFVFLEGSQFTTEEMDSFVNDNMSLINNWVKQGGCLLINAAPGEGDGVNFDQFGVNLTRAESFEGSAADETHPIFTEPYTPTQTSFNASPLSGASLSGENLSAIISDITNQILLGEQKSGLGRVVFGGLTLPLFNQWNPETEYTNLHKNIIHYAATCFEPVSGVTLEGASVGGINTDYTFTATVRPANTGPITYTWQATGESQQIHPLAGPVVTATFSWNTPGDKEVTVKVSSSSGEVSDDYSIEIAANAPPEAREVTITPSQVENHGLSVAPDGTDISVSYIYHDDDGDNEEQTRIVWTRDDQISQQEQPKLNNRRTVSGKLTTIAEERWCATVEAHDGTSYGEPVEACVYIGRLPGNLLPTAENVEIPAHPSEEDALEIGFESSDVDGSIDEDQTQLRWYRDNVLQPAFNDQEVVEAKDTNIGEQWCAKVRVSDGTNFGLTVDSNCGMISPKGNTLPVISNPRITPTMPTSSDDLSIIYGYVDPDGDEENKDNTIIRWLRDGQLQPEFNNKRSVDARFTIAGEKWRAVIQPHDGKDYGRFEITPPVHISEGQSKNTPPEVVNVKINPAEPSAGQDLRLIYEFSDPDEGDVEQGTIIRWYKWNSSLQNSEHMSKYDNLTVVPAADTGSSEIWYAVVIPYDGKAYGPDVPAHSVTIGQANSPPEALGVVLGPAMPGDDDDLVVSYEYDDQNDDQQGATEIRWTIDGSEKAGLAYLGQSRISHRYTFVGQKWCAQVTPHDGNQRGEPVQSNCVTIAEEGQNTAPTISPVYIEPAVPRSSDDLTLRYEYDDPDFEDEGNTIIRWRRNGTRLEFYDDQTVIPASETSPGDVWTVVVQPLDRSGTTGKMKSSPPVTINLPPQVESVEVDPQEAVTNQDLTVFYEYKDDDDHPASDPRITWYKNGRHVPEFENQRTIPASETSPGERWQASIYAFDGYEYSQKYRAAEIKIGARLYLPLIIRQRAQPPTPTPTLVPNAPTPTASPTNIPPSPTPTPAPFEPNNTSLEAYGPLEFGQFYEAYPEDEDDWYYIMLYETTSLEVIVNNYAPAPGGQVVVYREYFDTDNQLQRRVVGSDGREKHNMQIPNEVNPNALKDLPQGKYLIRIYTVANYSRDRLYELQSNRR